MRQSIGIAAAIVMAAAGSAQAGYTSFGTSGEPSLFSIFSTTYGSPGSLTQTTFEGTGTQAPFTFGAYTFTRVNDNGGSTPTNLHSLVAPTTNEDLFSDGLTDVQFTVKYAGNNNTLGWVDHSSSAVAAVNAGNFVPILGTVPNSSTTVTLSSSFQLALNSSGTYWGSNTATNTDTSDHLMTWFVQGNGQTFFVVAWEDLPVGGGADRDYNDWVGELQVVPLPPAAWAGLGSLACVAGFGVIRRRRLAAN